MAVTRPLTGDATPNVCPLGIGAGSAFVLAEYFGYLRRDPDQGGYQFWLNVLNNREPGNIGAWSAPFLLPRNISDGSVPR
jgi:hypothetical protein